MGKIKFHHFRPTMDKFRKKLLVARPGIQVCRRECKRSKCQCDVTKSHCKCHWPFWNWELIFGTDSCEGLPVWYTHFWIKFVQFVPMMLSLMQIKYIHQCENTDHVYAIVRTSPLATHMVRAGTVLVTPTVNSSGICTADMDFFCCVIL